MTRNLILTVILTGALLAAMVAGATAQDDQMDLGSRGYYAKPERPSVVFGHAFHADKLDCMQCHHNFDNGENIWNPGDETNCSACHAVEDGGARSPLTKAYHDMCIGCHQATLDKGQKSGPTACGQCHVRGE